MALTFTQHPIEAAIQTPVITNWTPIVPYMVNKSSISGLFYYKFIMEIRETDVSGALLAKIKQRKSAAVSGVTNVKCLFDVRDIINTHLETQRAVSGVSSSSIHTVGEANTSYIFSQNSSQIKKIYVRVYEEYSSSASQPPIEQTGGAINGTLFYIEASLPLGTARGTTYFQGTAFEGYRMVGTSSKVLSDIEKSYQKPNFINSPTTLVYRNYVRTKDYHTIAFINGETDFESVGKYWKVEYFSKPATSIGSYEFINQNSNGGANPLTASGEVNSDIERLIYFGSGPANLEAYNDGGSNAHRPSNNSGWAYYSVHASSTSGGSAKSDTYYFIKDDDNCKGFDIRRLAWRNSKGCYDYFNFKMKSTQTIDIKRNTYETMIGEYGRVLFEYDTFKNGIEVRETSARVTETINTDFLNEAEANLLESLLVSTKVDVVQDGTATTYTVPVTIKDSKFIRKTIANNKLIQYTITIEYSQPLNTNS